MNVRSGEMGTIDRVMRDVHKMLIGQYFMIAYARSTWEEISERILEKRGLRWFNLSQVQVNVQLWNFVNTAVNNFWLS